MALDVHSDCYVAPCAVGGIGRPYNYDPRFDNADLKTFVNDHLQFALEGLGSSALMVHMPHGFDEAGSENPNYPAINAPTVSRFRVDFARTIVRAFRERWTSALYVYLSGYGLTTSNGFNPALNTFAWGTYDGSVEFARSCGCSGVLFDAALAPPMAAIARQRGHILGNPFVVGSEASGTHISPPTPEPILNTFSIEGLRNYKTSNGQFPTAPTQVSWLQIQFPDAPITPTERDELSVRGWFRFAPTGRRTVFS
jgi:hypothetical protein